MAIRQQVSRKNTFRLWRLLALCLVLLAAAGGIFYQYPTTLQDIGKILRSAVGSLAATSNSPSPLSGPPLRGTIFDRNFNELAVSYPLFTLFVNPADLPDKERAAQQLAPILQKDPAELLAKLKQPDPVITLATKLDQEEREAVQHLQLSGVTCQPSSGRYYPSHTAGAYLIGVMQEDVGLAGAEYLYDHLLKPGEFLPGDRLDIDLQGQMLLGERSIDVLLTMDLILQKRLEAELETYLKAGDFDRGVAVLMDIKSGHLFALSVQPGFDPNYFWQHEELFEDVAFANNLSADLLRPILVRASALLEQSGSSDDVALPPETVAALDFGVSDAVLQERTKDMQFFEQTPLRTGYERKTGGVDSAGFTVLQLACGVSGLANGGWRVAPRLFDSLFDHGTGKRFSLRKESAVQGNLRMTEPSDGIRLRRDLLASLPKGPDGSLMYTSTVNKLVDGKGYQRQELFFTLSPAEAPQTILMLVAVKDHLDPSQELPVRNDPQKLARKLVLLPLMAKVSHDAGLTHPGEKNPENMRRFLISRRMDYHEIPEETGVALKVMPDLVGLSLRKGLQRLGSGQFKVTVSGSGRITSQKPAPGQPMEPGTVCQLILESKF